MTITETIQTLLEADATLMAILTGGIYTKEEVGELGMKNENTVVSAAWTEVNEYPVLQPCLVVQARGFVLDGTRWDVESKTASGRQAVVLWFYNDQSAGWTAIQNASNRCYQLLAMEPVAGAGILTPSILDDKRPAPELDNVNLLRAEYRSTRSIT